MFHYSELVLVNDVTVSTSGPRFGWASSGFHRQQHFSNCHCVASCSIWVSQAKQGPAWWWQHRSGQRSVEFWPKTSASPSLKPKPPFLNSPHRYFHKFTSSNNAVGEQKAANVFVPCAWRQRSKGVGRSSRQLKSPLSFTAYGRSTKRLPRTITAGVKRRSSYWRFLHKVKLN